MHFMDMVKLMPGPHVWTLTGTPSPSNGKPRTCGMARITVNTILVNRVDGDERRNECEVTSPNLKCIKTQQIMKYIYFIAYYSTAIIINILFYKYADVNIFILCQNQLIIRRNTRHASQAVGSCHNRHLP